jgi:UDP-glucose 4-epimerase
VRALVTGHRGFIGTNLKKYLESQKVEVIGMDLVEGNDIYHQDAYPREPVDIVYHLAATSDIRESFFSIAKMYHNNVAGTLTLLEWIRRNDVKKIVFSSSSSVYGKAQQMPTPETAATNPISHYAASKITGEAFIRSYCHLYGIKGWIFRFANVAGPYLAGGAIYDITRKLEADPANLEILGDGQQRKSYMDVSDCIRALTLFPEKIQTNDAEVYNLSGADNISVDGLTEVIFKHMKTYPTQTAYTGGEGGWPGDVPITYMDITKAKAEGWHPKYTSEEVIKRTLKKRNTWKDKSTEA